MKKITELTAELAAPAIAEQGCTLWDVEYVKEAGTWYLRILIDKEGGVDILDCEAISRKVSDLLDVHLQILLLLVHVYHHVLHALVVTLVGGGQRLNDLAHHEALGNAPLLFQHGKRRKNFVTLHVVSPYIKSS